MAELDGNGPSTSGETELDVLKKRAKLMGITHSNNITVETLRAKINAKLNDEDDTDGAEEAASQNSEDDGETGSDGSGGDTGASEEAAPVPPVAAPAPVAPVAAQAPQPEVIVAPQPIAPTPAVPAPVAPVVQPAPAPAPEPVVQEAPKKVKKLSLRQHIYNEQMKLVRVRIANLDPKKKDLPGEIFTVANEFLGTVRKFIPYGEVTDDGWHVPYCIYTQLRDRKFLNISTTKDRRSGHIQTKQAWTKEFALDVLDDLSQEELNRLAVAQAAAGSLDG